MFFRKKISNDTPPSNTAIMKELRALKLAVDAITPSIQTEANDRMVAAAQQELSCIREHNRSKNATKKVNETEQIRAIWRAMTIAWMQSN